MEGLATDIRQEASETLEWIENWRDGMFTPAHTADGWTVEMYGLVDSAEKLARAILSRPPEADPRLVAWRSWL